MEVTSMKSKKKNIAVESNQLKKLSLKKVTITNLGEVFAGGVGADHESILFSCDPKKWFCPFYTDPTG